MGRVGLIFALLFATLASGQAFPIALTGPQVFTPAIDGSGKSVVFGSSINPDGTGSPAIDLFFVNTDGTSLRRLTKITAGAGAIGPSLSPDAKFAAFTQTVVAGSNEEVHLVTVASATDRTIAVDKQGCILPLALCFGCFFSCLRTPHIFDDAGAVLYAAARNQPLYVARVDGSAPVNLPVFSAVLVNSSKRAMSSKGDIVFTSSAPFGPTLVAAPTQVYIMKQDGTGIRALTKFTDFTVSPVEATISADGTAFAFTAATSNGTALYVGATDGSNVGVITTGNLSSPSLSADGLRLCYVLDGQVTVSFRNTASAPATLTKFQYSQVLDATISDDGSRVALSIGPRGGNARGAIYSLATLNGGPANELTALYGLMALNGLTALYAPRSLNVNGIAGAVAGSLATAYGLNLAADTLNVASSFPLPTALGGLSLTMNGISAPLTAVSPWQVNVQIPLDSTIGPVAFEAAFTDNSRTPPVAADVALINPSVYLLPSVRSGQAAVFHGNTVVAADATHPATAGEILVMYASGLGPVDRAVPAGTASPADPPANATMPLEIHVANRVAKPIFAGLAPGFAGVYQVNFALPTGVPAGDVSVTIVSPGTSGSNFSGVISVK